MLNYAFVNSDTSFVKNLMEFGNEQIASNYVTPTNQYSISLTDEIFNQMKADLLAGNLLYVMNRAATTYEQMINVIPQTNTPQPTDIELLQQKVTELHQDNLLLLDKLKSAYVQLNSLQGSNQTVVNSNNQVINQIDTVITTRTNEVYY